MARPAGAEAIKKVDAYGEHAEKISLLPATVEYHLVHCNHSLLWEQGNRTYPVNRWQPPHANPLP